MKKTVIDESLLQFCANEYQKKCMQAVIDQGSLRAASRELNTGYGNIHRIYCAVLKRAAMKGHTDIGKPVYVPDPFMVKRRSTMFRVTPQGERVPINEWLIQEPDKQKAIEALQEFVTFLTQDAKGLSPMVEAPLYTSDDLLAIYPIGDPHFGMYAWAEEAGEDFDLNEAVKVTQGAIDRLVNSAPPASTAILLELGDFFHTDNESNRTNGHGHALDVDTRWAKVMQIGLRSMILATLRLLEKHQNVIVRIVKGNHDDHSSFALALAIDAFFTNNARVKVDLSPSTFWYYQFGKVLIASTHGDSTKMADLPSIMAHDVPLMWGSTEFRYWYQGHIHHQDVKEYRGVTCEAFRTLAARDAWHNSKGYRAGRDMRLIVHHKDYGEIERHRCDVAMLR